jgi:hypothetical protein
VGWRIAIGVVVRIAAMLGALLAMFLVWTFVNSWGILIRVPSEHDARLVGVWKTATASPYGANAYILRPDGTGQLSHEGGRSVRPINWGTQDGVFVDKHFSTDAWGKDARIYRISPDGRVLKLGAGDAVTEFLRQADVVR